MDNDCQHIYGEGKAYYESWLIRSKKELEYYKADGQVSEEFTFCPKCGARLVDNTLDIH